MMGFSLAAENCLKVNEMAEVAFTGLAEMKKIISSHQPHPLISETLKLQLLQEGA